MANQELSNLTVQQLSELIHPCEMEKPFAFVSYCSKDSKQVWQDVIYLQNRGFNLWIDKNLKETEDSWHEGAMNAIKDIDCRLIVFFLSRNSATSAPCLKELRQSESEEAKAIHGGKKVPLICIEVDPVPNLKKYREEIYENLAADTAIPRETRNQMSLTLSQIVDNFLVSKDENREESEKVRIKGNSDESRRYDYYKKIEEILTENGIEKLSAAQMYIKAVNMLEDEAKYSIALGILEYCSNEFTYLPAILLNAFIYETGVCGERNHNKAKDSLLWAGLQSDESEWMSKGKEYKDQKNYEVAVAYYSGAAAAKDDVAAFREASRIWLKMKHSSFAFTKECLKNAGRLGCKKSMVLFEKMSEITKTDFEKYQKKYS